MSRHLTRHHLYPRHPRRLRILIVSSNPTEQKTLKRFFEKQGHVMDQAEDKNRLLAFLAERKAYDLVIVSDCFKGIGLTFFALYFRKGMSKRRPKLIYLGNEVLPPGFDVQIWPSFLTRHLLQFLMKMA